MKKRPFCSVQRPWVHKPSSKLQLSNVKSESPFTHHMVQWESARVEAESRLSMEPLLLKPSSMGRTDSDYFLRLWNTEVGESFRKMNGKDGEACQCSVSQASLCIKSGSGSDVTVQRKNTRTWGATNMTPEQEDSYRPMIEDAMASPNSLTSYNLVDSSDTAAFDLLLDFPDGDDVVQG